jgi:hypothetical protein
VVYAGRLPIVPSDRYRIPARFSNDTAVSGITPPTNASALRERLGFGDGQCRARRYLQAEDYIPSSLSLSLSQFGDVTPK